jgi:hypothetical protein
VARTDRESSIAPKETLLAGAYPALEDEYLGGSSFQVFAFPVGSRTAKLIL